MSSNLTDFSERQAFIPPRPATYELDSVSSELDDYTWKTISVPATSNCRVCLRETRKTGEQDEEPRIVVLASHGNGDDVGTFQDYAQFLVNAFSELGSCFVVTYDYAGYGQSTGERATEQGMYEAADAAFAHASSLAPSVLLVYGKSLGSIPTAYLASKHTTKIHGVILVSAIASGFRVFCPGAPSRIARAFDNIFGNNLRMISQANAPVLVIHGAEDNVVSVSSARDLTKAIPEKFRRQPVIVQNAGHNDIETRYYSIVVRSMREFVSQIIVPKQCKEL